MLQRLRGLDEHLRLESETAVIERLIQAAYQESCRMYGRVAACGRTLGPGSSLKLLLREGGDGRMCEHAENDHDDCGDSDIAG